ncbi:hypothetical protein FALBO_17376, partial [Fusarium albosuccineum]
MPLLACLMYPSLVMIQWMLTYPPNTHARGQNPKVRESLSSGFRDQGVHVVRRRFTLPASSLAYQKPRSPCTLARSHSSGLAHRADTLSRATVTATATYLPS